jgi:hypothetical protein
MFQLTPRARLLAVLVLVALAAILIFGGWRWLAGVLGLGAAGLAVKAGAMKARSEDLKRRADALAAEAEAEAKAQEERMKAGEENAKAVEDLKKRTQRIKAKWGLPMILVGALLVAMWSAPARAEEPAVPADYAGLKELYLSALNTIAELKADLAELASICDEWERRWDIEHQLRLQAEAAASRGLDREKELQAALAEQHEIIIAQHQTILKLATQRQGRISVGVSLPVQVADTSEYLKQLRVFLALSL